MLCLLLGSAFSVAVPYYRGCVQGLVETHYNDEDASEFKSLTYSTHLPYTGDLNLEWESITWKGAYCAPKTGTYEFLLSGKPVGYIEIAGQRSNDLGGNSRCDDRRQEGYIKLQLQAHKCYPLWSYFKSGCALWKDHLRVTMNIDGVAYQTETLRASDVISCYETICEDGYYGSDCSGKCNVDCHGNGYCSNGTAGTGKCICYTGSPEYGCLSTPAFTPSKHFTASDYFTPSKSFTPSTYFSPSKYFTPSNTLSPSSSFRPSTYFTLSNYRLLRKARVTWGIGLGSLTFVHGSI